MACNSLITQGFQLDCADSVAGIETIYIANLSEVTAFTESAGTISTITQAVGASIYEYQVEEQVADFVSTMQKNVENGTLYWETVLNFSIDKLSAAKSEEIKLMAAARNLIVIIKGNDGNYYGLGFDKINGEVGGAKLFGGTNQAASGAAFADRSGYTLGITAMEKHYPYLIDSAVVDGLTKA